MKNLKLTLSIIFFFTVYANLHAIIKGTLVDPNESGFVKVQGCSGTMLTNEWLLTATHCFSTANKNKPETVNVQMGDQESKAAVLISNFGAPCYLVRLQKPFSINGSKTGFRRFFYKGTDSSLMNKYLTCYGYGYNTPTNGFGLLRTAILQVTTDDNKCTFDCYRLKSNSDGQILGEGDSGGAALYNLPDGEQVIAGATWYSDESTYSAQVSSSKVYGWAMHHINKDNFASSLTSGDFNNDGFEDLAVGMPGASIGNISWTGVVQIFMGSLSGLNFKQTLNGHAILSNETGDQFGYDLKSGDFNGDGFDDLAIGAPGKSIGSMSRSGYVFLYKGNSNGLDTWHGLDQQGIGSNEDNDQFGYSLAIGDFNGDGKDDLAVGGPGEAPGSNLKSGYVYIFKGGEKALQPWHGIDQIGLGANEEPDRFGSSLAAGDFNGDGKSDLAVGAPSELTGPAGNTAYSGYAFVFKGTTSKLVPWMGLSQETDGLDKNENAELFGWALAAGDIDGDGKDDLAVTAPREMASDLGSIRVGAVFLFKGATQDLKGWQVVTQQGAGSREVSDWFGASVAIADLNNDGKDDLVVGSPGEDPSNSPESGYTFVFRSQTTTLKYWGGLEQTNLDSNEKGDWFGDAVTVGNYLGSNKLGIVIGAPGDKAGTTSKGRAYYFSIHPQSFKLEQQLAPNDMN